MSTSKQFGYLVAFVLMVSMTAHAHYDEGINQRINYKNYNSFNNELKTRMRASMGKYLCDYTSTSTSCTWTSIRSDQVCDGTDDCMDRTDEMGCPSTPVPTTCPTCDMKCSDTEFTCKNETCIPIEQICDGNNDCGDMSDETGSICDKCTCPDGQFQCTFTKKCIPRTQLCDGFSQCMDDTDEPNNCLCTINSTRASFCADGDPRSDTGTIAIYHGDIPLYMCENACRINKACAGVVLLWSKFCLLRSNKRPVGNVVLDPDAGTAKGVYQYFLCQ